MTTATISSDAHDKIYEMRISFHVLSHLGINLYSNVAAVITETVANAWDADAKIVNINIDEHTNTITVTDDGHGMTISDANEKFLYIGYQRRQNGEEESPEGRKVMGRKGIGKLSLFSIADTVRVFSVKDGERHAFEMSVPAIKSAIDSGAGTYHPKPLNIMTHHVEKGTNIEISDIKRSRLSVSASSLRRRLARRFSILGSSDFRVFINGVEILPSDRDDAQHTQFLWWIGDENEYTPANFPNVIKKAVLPGTLPGYPAEWGIKGWIGSASKPAQLKGDGGNLNSVVVLARGRLVQENILDRINYSRIFTKYLTGQIEANFLDDDHLQDIATSDRQRLMEDDERYRYLEMFIRKMLNNIADQWTEWRNESGVDKAVEENPALLAWIDSLSDGVRPHARKLLSRIEALELDDRPNEKRELFRHAIYAFERLRLKEMSDTLADAISYGAEKLIPLLEKHDDLEASFYYDIAKTRVDVIKAFLGLVDGNAKEKVLQKYLFDHLWLLDPSWERADDSALMEIRVQTEWGAIDAKLTDEEKKGRLDIKYKTTAGKHLIIELKKSDRAMNVVSLVEQGLKYKSAVEKCAETTIGNIPDIEVVFVLGKPVIQADRDEFVRKQMESINGRIVYYDQLIDGALRAYNDYLERQKQVAKIRAIADSI